MFERPLLLWLLIAAPLVAAPGFIAMRGGRWFGAAASTALRLVCFVALVMLVAGFRLPIKLAAQRMALIVAVDESRSIASDQHAWMTREVAALRHAMSTRDRLAVLGFGRDARLLSPLADPRLLSLTGESADPSATNIADALTTAAGIFPETDEKRLIILSDGNETQGRALDELPALADQGVRIFAAAPPHPADPRVALTDFEAPDVVRADTSFALRIGIESEARDPVDAKLKLSADSALLGSQTVTLKPGLNRFELPYRIDRGGSYLMKAEIELPPPLVAVNASAETGVSIAPPPHVLVVSANSPPQSLIGVLKLRHYDVQEAGAHGLPASPAAYLPYQAVILANVPAEALADDVQQALNRYVADFGGGLIVTGDSLRDSKFHDSTLEKTLPITFEPQPPPPSREPLAIYLLIDRSNSMSYNSRYPAVRDYERIRYAKEAGLALLNQLDDTDYVGVIAFDSEPYVLSHLRPLGEVRAEVVNRIQRLEPGGGTDFKDALEIAEREILSSGLPVRQVILLTDGDTNRQYHDHDRLMADYAKEQIPVSTIRIGPDLENLRLLQDFAHVTSGVFYRVEDISKLPQLLVHLTHEAQNFKRRQRNQIGYGSPSSILNGISPREVPPIDFFALTQAKEGAEVPLIVRNGPKTSPLLATWQYELGRSAIFAADPDSLGSLAWIRWDRYAEFWSQLVSWVAREGDSGNFTLKVTNAPDGTLKIEAQNADNRPVTNLVSRITGPGRAADIAMTQVGTRTYQGESAPLPRGKYAVVLMMKAVDTERVLLRREVAVVGSQPADAAELRLMPANVSLLRQLAHGTGGEFNAPVAQMLKRSGATITSFRAVDPLLLPLVIVLVLGEVFVRRRYLGD